VPPDGHFAVASQPLHPEGDGGLVPGRRGNRKTGNGHIAVAVGKGSGVVEMAVGGGDGGTAHGGAVVTVSRGIEHLAGDPGRPRRLIHAIECQRGGVAGGVAAVLGCPLVQVRHLRWGQLAVEHHHLIDEAVETMGVAGPVSANGEGGRIHDVVGQIVIVPVSLRMPSIYRRPPLAKL
jgi:hypothetical protein